MTRKKERHKKRKRKWLLYVILSVSEISTLSLYVILSVSEISHDQSEKYMPVSSSVGFFTIVQNDVKKVRGIYFVLYSKGLPQSLRSFAMTVKKVRHIERKRD